jgi:hypothetical protein
MQGWPLQQRVSLLQFCPKSAQTVPLPPSPLGGGGPHVPLGAPGVMLQTLPAQQSPVAVQVPPDCTQTTPASFAVVVRHRNVPVESGTHGIRLQHSAEVAQVSPGLRQQFGSVPL